MRDLNIGVITGIHEFDGGQYEIDLTYSDALDAADRSFRFKAAVKEPACKEGHLATFMARPFGDAGGSGSPLHLPCADADDRNAFDDPAGVHGLSATTRHAGANACLLVAGTIAAALLGIRAGEEPPAPLDRKSGCLEGAEGSTVPE